MFPVFGDGSSGDVVSALRECFCQLVIAQWELLVFIFDQVSQDLFYFSGRGFFSGLCLYRFTEEKFQSIRPEFSLNKFAVGHAADCRYVQVGARRNVFQDHGSQFGFVAR